MISILHQYCSGDEIENNGMSGACSTYGERRGVYRIVVEKIDGKRPVGRPKFKWEDNIKMDFWKLDEVALTRLIWFRIGTGGGHL